MPHTVRLKQEQPLCLESVWGGKNVVAVLPTGYGKSLIYQLMLWAFDGLVVGFEEDRLPSSTSCVLFVSPLAALMTEQVRRARALGLSSAELSCSSRFETDSGCGSLHDHPDHDDVLADRRKWILPAAFRST